MEIVRLLKSWLILLNNCPLKKWSPPWIQKNSVIRHSTTFLARPWPDCALRYSTRVIRHGESNVLYISPPQSGDQKSSIMRIIQNHSCCIQPLIQTRQTETEMNLALSRKILTLSWPCREPRVPILLYNKTCQPDTQMIKIAITPHYAMFYKVQQNRNNIIY